METNPQISRKLKDVWNKLLESWETDISVVCSYKKHRKWKEKLYPIDHLGLNQEPYIWAILFTGIFISVIFVSWSLSPSVLNFLNFFFFFP